MKRPILYGCCYVAAVIFGYATIAHGDPVELKEMFVVRKPQAGPPRPEVYNRVSSAALPLYQYTETADSTLGGGRFNGYIVGDSPLNKIKTTTTLTVQIIPLIITINDGTTTVVYDPTLTDPCVTAGTFTGVQVITGSPIFQNLPWTMNGVNVGTTQYIDAFQRAQNWSLVGGTNYHLILNPVVLPAQSFSVTTGNRKNYSNQGTCHANVGVMDINAVDATFQSLITGPLAASVNPGTFPVFLTRNVVMSDGIVSNCCILGYHDVFTGAGGGAQIYSPFSLDSAGVFGSGFVSTLSHEMGEAIDDPLINNQTPVWGNIGQVGAGGQNNFEVGDPLSPGFSTPTNSFTVTGANGLTYKLQELAFYSWFFGHKSTGTGGKYSNNGTFNGFMKLNSAGGGTN